MKAILQFLERERWWPLWVILIGLLVLTPGLGSSGFWEPHEINIADKASERAGLTDDEPDPPATAGNRAKKPDKKAEQPSGPPLTEWVVGRGIEHIGAGEVGARLPLAMLGVLAMIATFLIGWRLSSPRAGLLAALVLVTFPLFILQSRQLMSDIGAVTGSALTIAGLIGIAWPAGRRPIWLYGIDVALIAGGAVISYLAAAALLGIVVPFGAVALACMGALVGKLPGATDCAESAPRPVGDPYLGHPRTLVAGLIAIGVSLTWAVIEGMTDSASGARFSGVLIAALVGVGLVLVGVLPSRARLRAHKGDARWHTWHLGVAALAAGAVAVGALFLVFGQAFDLRDPVPGERALLGYSLIPSEQYSEALGGVWKLRDDLKITFDSMFEQIAYGLFPWVALAPIALAQLAMAPRRRGRHAWSGYVIFAWAALAWIVSVIMMRKVGPVIYPGLVAIAVGLGVWLDDLLCARNQADATTESQIEARTEFGVTLRLPLVALFVALCVFVLCRDLRMFPDKLVSITADGATIKYPSGATPLKIELKTWLAIFGLLFTVCLAASLALWRRCRSYREPHHVLYRFSRHGIHAAVGVGLVFALFMTHVWLPELSRKFSTKHLFSVYHELHAEGDELGIMGHHGSGPKYYAGGEFEHIANRQKLLEFLRKDNRVFAFAPAAELCAVHRTVKGSVPYHVLDDSNAKFLLLSNRLKPGERDRNPLAQAMVRSAPDGIEVPLKINYDNRVELIGVNAPASVERGDTFTMTLFFKVLRPIGGNWKIFVHFDGGGLRFQGDHEPIRGRCGTSFWQAGDYIIDTFEVSAGDISYSKSMYTMYVGLFRGSHGNWKNMPVVSSEGPSDRRVTADSNNRVRIGQIRVK